MPMSCLRRVRIISNRVCSSWSVRVAEGSSITMIFAFMLSALAISTICCCATLSSATGVRTSIFSPTRCRTSSASLYIFFQSMKGVLAFLGSLPRKMFSATLR